MATYIVGISDISVSCIHFTILLSESRHRVEPAQRAKGMETWSCASTATRLHFHRFSIKQGFASLSKQTCFSFQRKLRLCPVFFFFYTAEGVEALLLIKVSDMNDMRKKCSCLPGNRLVTKGTVLEEQRPAGVFIRQRGWLWQDSK